MRDSDALELSWQHNSVEFQLKKSFKIQVKELPDKND